MAATDALDRDIERLVQALGILASDVKAAASLSVVADTPFTRRTYVRAAFALVEGNINLMAEVILDAVQRQEIHLPPEDIAILRQDTSDKAGSPVRNNFVPIKKRISQVFRMFSCLFGKSFRLDKGSTGWVDFCKAIDVRNRITHPKNAASFDIDDSEFEAVERAREWYAHSVERLLEDC